MAADYTTIRQRIARDAERVEAALFSHLSGRDRLAVIQAPPGSGKTHLLIRAVDRARKLGHRIAVATQTNAQADDICRRLAKDYPKVHAIRFPSGSADPINLGTTIAWEADHKKLPSDACIVVGTTAKWGAVELRQPFDVLFVEEAWQMSWSSFMLLGQVAGRFVMIGDPGQIAPVVAINVSRWETSPRPPHVAAPQVILEDDQVTALKLSLPASRRLPNDTVEFVKRFYSFEFQAWAAPGERAILADRGGNDGVDRALDLLRSGSIVGATLPTPAGGPPLEQDDEVAKAAVALAVRLLKRGAQVRLADGTGKLTPADIGLAATHRVMNSAMELALPSDLRGQIRVDTPERWQGLERKVMIIVHPLSGVLRPSSFDLETGRLCVMASRHIAGLVVLTRDHLEGTLDGFIPSADQPVGRADAAGRGHALNLGFWETLKDRKRVVSLN